MKNIAISLMLLGSVLTAWSQEAADKKVQAGLIVGYGMNFQKMGTKYLQTNGVGSDLTIGANVNFSLTETIGFCTGVEFDFESLKYSVPAGDSVFYFYQISDNNLIELNDENLAELSNPNSDLSQGANIFELSSRKQKPTYLTIPTMLTFRTKYIGYLRYFGKFGLRTSVLLSNKFTDEGSSYNTAGELLNNDDNKDMRAKLEMFPIKSSVGLSGGAEWNFTGATVLVGELGFYYGFTPLYNKRTYLANTGGNNNGSGNDVYFANKATQMQLMLKISVLF